MEAEMDKREGSHAGELLRELRKKHGWTQLYVAEKAGCSDTNISHIENGNRLLTGDHIAALERADIFSASELQRLRMRAGVDTARAANIDLDELMRAPLLESCEELFLTVRRLRLKD